MQVHQTSNISHDSSSAHHASSPHFDCSAVISVGLRLITEKCLNSQSCVVSVKKTICKMVSFNVRMKCKSSVHEQNHWYGSLTCENKGDKVAEKIYF